MGTETPKVGPSGNGESGSYKDPRLRQDLSAFEKHYSIEEIAMVWNLSVDSVRRLFEREPGVLVVGGAQKRGKRRYRTLRIPESVVERVHRRQLLLYKQ